MRLPVRGYSFHQWGSRAHFTRSISGANLAKCLADTPISVSCMKILYSLPIHESSDVVLDTIGNINKFSPDNYIVLHVNPTFTQFNHNDFSVFSNVLINPERHSFEWGQSLLRIHDSNILHALSCKGDISHVCLMSSNQMFVRHGIEMHIKAHVAGVQVLPCSTYYIRELKSNKQFSLFMSENGLTQIYKGHWEGCFFDVKTYMDVSVIINRYFTRQTHELHLEEFVYPMIINRWRGTDGVSSPVCYMDIGLHPSLAALDKTIIDMIRAQSPKLRLRGRIRASKYQNIKRFILRNTNIYRRVGDLYMVKRVPRKIDDPLRVYINSIE